MTKAALISSARAPQRYGVMIHYERSGDLAVDDRVHFDGWYSNKVMAEDVCDMLSRRYPGARTHVVQSLKHVRR